MSTIHRVLVASQAIRQGVANSFGRRVIMLAVLTLVCGITPTGCGGSGKGPNVLAEGYAPISGRRVSVASTGMSGVDEASAKALAAVLRSQSPGGAIRSEGDLQSTVCGESHTWDHLFATRLFVAAGEQDAARRAVDALLDRQKEDGSWPVTVCLDVAVPDPTEPTTRLDNLKPGPSQTAYAVALLAGLVNRGHPAIDRAVALPRLVRALTWLKRVWLDDPRGGLAIGTKPNELLQASTEGTALGVFAAIELERLFPECCKALVLDAASLLTKTLWAGDHFHRGANRVRPDEDQTGPHTHQSLAVLALVAAAHAFPDEAPDPAEFDPTLWLREYFTRTSSSAGRQVVGLGDRLVVVDPADVLYGCDGGLVARRDGITRLDCPSSPAVSLAASAAQPTRSICQSPYDTCAIGVPNAPPGALAVEAVNSEITLLGAVAAMGLGRSELAATWLNGGLALQRPSGAVIAIAGPKRFRYPQNYRVRQFGYTALFGLALRAENPFLVETKLADALPLGLHFPKDQVDITSVNLTSARPDPESADPVFRVRQVDSTTSSIMVTHLARTDPDGGIPWVRAETALDEDRDWPAACFRLKFDISTGGWSGAEVKILDRHGENFRDAKSGKWSHRNLTHGIKLSNLSATPRHVEVDLAKLPLFWSRKLDADALAFTLDSLDFVLTDPTKAITSGEVWMKLENVALSESDCMEGSPPRFESNPVAVDGLGNHPPTVDYTTLDGKLALHVPFDLRDDGHRWQQVSVYDRWNWRCARLLELHYAVAQPTRVQLIIEDAQADRDPGAQRFVEKTLVPGPNQWQTWSIDIGELKRFDLDDPRDFRMEMIRKVSVSIIHAADASQQGDVYLERFDAMAPKAVLAADGGCT